MASKALKELVRLSFVNGEDENSRDEGFVLWKVRERRRKFGNFLNDKVARAWDDHPLLYKGRITCKRLLGDPPLEM